MKMSPFTVIDIGVRLRLLHISYKHTHNKVTHKKAAHSTLQETHTVLHIKAVAIPLSETEQCVVLVGVCHQLACGQWCISQSPERKYHTQTPEHEPEEERRASQEKYMRKRRDRRKHWPKTLHEHCSSASLTLNWRHCSLRVVLVPRNPQASVGEMVSHKR